MTFFVDIKPLKSRALDGECGPAVLNAIANKLNRLGRVPNIYQLSMMVSDFIEPEVRRAARHLELAGFISSHVEAGTGDLKHIELTDAGWDASDFDKPIWMGNAT